jgi:hypothetical protein
MNTNTPILQHFWEYQIFHFFTKNFVPEDHICFDDKTV